MSKPVAFLTPRQVAILRQMAAHVDDEDGELVYERGVGYLGLERVAPRTVFALLRLCAITSENEPGGVERFHITGTGLQLLRGDLSYLRLINAARLTLEVGR